MAKVNESVSIVNYWECIFSDYECIFDGENEHRIYGCSHPKGCGYCDKDNQYNDKEEYCSLLDSIK